MYCFYGKSNRGHGICPLYRSCPPFGESVIRGFTIPALLVTINSLLIQNPLIWHLVWIINFIVLLGTPHYAFKVPIMLCSNFNTKPITYAHCFVPIMFLIYSILQIDTWQFIRKLALHESFVSIAHISVLRTDKLQPCYIDYIAH